MSSTGSIARSLSRPTPTSAVLRRSAMLRHGYTAISAPRSKVVVLDDEGSRAVNRTKMLPKGVLTAENKFAILSGYGDEEIGEDEDAPADDDSGEEYAYGSEDSGEEEDDSADDDSGEEEDASADDDSGEEEDASADDDSGGDAYGDDSGEEEDGPYGDDSGDEEDGPADVSAQKEDAPAPFPAVDAPLQ